MGNIVALIILVSILSVTSYICGFVMGYEFNDKENENGRKDN